MRNSIVLSARWAVIALILIFSAPLAAQTFVVDANGGLGAHFRTIQEGVNNVPSGSTLHVRRGIYGTFYVRGKGLRIVGEGRGLVQVRMDQRRLLLANTAASQPLLISGLSIVFDSNTPFNSTMQGFGLAGGLQLVDVEIRIEPQTFGGGLIVGVQFSDCDQIHLHRCLIRGGQKASVGLNFTRSKVQIESSRIEGGMGTSTLPFFGTGPRAVTCDDSQLVLINSSLTGAEGTPSSTIGSAHSRGASAILVRGGGKLTITGRPTDTIAGGRGGEALLGVGVRAGEGGEGVTLENGSMAVIEGVSPSGGAGGRASSSNLPGMPGSAFAVDASSVLVHRPLTLPPVTELRGSPAIGTIVHLDLHATPGSAAFLLASPSRTFIPLSDTLILGTLLVSTDALLLAALPVTQPTLAYPIRISPAWPPGVPLHLQFVVLQSGTLYLCNSTVVLPGF